MLSEKEKAEIEAELRHVTKARAASLEALKVVQRHRGWVDDNAVKDVAVTLETTAEEVDSVATFYSLIFRRPVGRHVILICDTISCWVMGFKDVREHLKKRLGIEPGSTTADGNFTLLPIACLGACDIAPAMMVDGVLYGNLTPERIDEIIGRFEGEV